MTDHGLTADRTLLHLAGLLRNDDADLLSPLTQVAHAGVAEADEYRRLADLAARIGETAMQLHERLNVAYLRELSVSIGRLFRRMSFEELLALKPGTVLWVKRESDGLSRFSLVTFQQALDLRAQENPRIKVSVKNMTALADIDVGAHETGTHRFHECVDTVRLADMLARYPILMPRE